MKFTILRFDSIDSTNNEAANQARKGAPEGLCVVARRQTKGRGRNGRNWISETDAGLFFSIVLRPKIETKYFPLVTLTAAVAVSSLLSEFYDLSPDIKWANDVLINDKKICGILAELIETNKNPTVILGIGVNLKSSNFPPELKETATAIEAETKNEASAETLLEHLTEKLNFYYEMLLSADGAAKIRDEWTRRSSYAFGKKVRAVLENETIYGETRGIEENGALRVKTETGEIKTIQAGDVEKLRKL